MLQVWCRRALSLRPALQQLNQTYVVRAVVAHPGRRRCRRTTTPADARRHPWTFDVRNSAQRTNAGLAVRRQNRAWYSLLWHGAWDTSVRCCGVAFGSVVLVVLVWNEFVNTVKQAPNVVAGAALGRRLCAAWHCSACTLLKCTCSASRWLSRRCTLGSHCRAVTEGRPAHAAKGMKSRCC